MCSQHRPCSVEGLLPAKVLELQDCDEDAIVPRQLQFYLEGTKLAKPCLDELVKQAVSGWEGCEVRCVGVKSWESAERKAKKSYGGDARKIADMARVSVVCDKPKDLEQAFVGITGRFEVSMHKTLRFTDDLQYHIV